MSDLHARLNQLANRGTRRGADAVIDAAAAGASLGVIDGDVSNDEADIADAHDPIPFVTAEPMRRPRRRFSSMIAAAGLSAMLLVGTLAISALVGSGGANSPEGAVRRLADAVHHGDPIAAADVMSPSEVRSLAGTVRTAEKKAAEMELVKTASEPLSGIDFSVDDLQLVEQPLADGYVKVSVNEGTLHASTKKAKFSALMQKVLRNADDNKTDIDLTQLAGSTGVGTFVVTVREGGHWYVSAAYTALEYVREYNQVSAQPHFGSGLQAARTLGADSPDAAVKNGINALAHNDWDALLALAPPSEIPVYDYRDVLKELITRNGAKTDFTVDALTTTSEIHGETASVVVKASGKSGDETWSVDGGCFAPPSDPQYSQPAMCVNSSANPLRFFYAVAGTGGVVTPDAGAPDQGITTVRHDGRWFVSPAGSVLDVLDKWIDTLDRRQLYLMLGLGSQLPPDGTLTLGQPVRVPHGIDDAKIVSFHGTKGQKLLGFEEPLGQPPNAITSVAQVLVYGPDGSRLADGESMFYGFPAELPADGTYTFVMTNASPYDRNVTVWNEKDAPEKARQPEPPGFVSGCTPLQNGVQSCSETAGGALPESTPVSTAPANAGG